MVRISILFVLIILLTALALPLFAEEEDQQDKDQTPYTEKLVVTADRMEEPVKETGSSVTIISREEIEKRKAPFVLDLLRTVPGVYISQSGSVGKITSVFVRGAGSDQTLVMIDGVQINDSNGFIDLGNLSTANIERIEIVRGPQSPLYGSDAMGGVINIITRRDTNLVSARAEGGSDSTFLGAIRGAYGSERNRIALEYNRYTTDGETANDDFDNRTIVADARVQVTDSTNVGFIYRDADGDVGIPFLTGVPTPDQRQKNNFRLIHVPFTQRVTSWWDSEIHFSRFQEEVHYRHPSDPFGVSFSDTNARTTTFNFSNTFRPAENQSAIAGYEYERIRIDDVSNFGVNLDNAEVSNNAVYGQYQFPVGDQLTITAGVRLDHHSVFGNDTNPRIAVAYRAIPEIKLRGTIATGFRAPRPGELSGPFGNADLQPENVKSFDFGGDVDVVPGIFSASASVFHNAFDNMIGFNLDTFRFANFVKVKTSGLELDGLLQPLVNLQIRGAYTYLTTKDETKDQELLRRPKNSGSINVDYRFRKFGVNYNWNFVGERLDINDVVFPPANAIDDAYNRADAVLSYQLTREIQVYGKILNLFDRSYQEVFGFAAPNRGFFLGIKIY